MWLSDALCIPQNPKPLTTRDLETRNEGSELRDIAVPFRGLPCFLNLANIMKHPGTEEALDEVLLEVFAALPPDKSFRWSGLVAL